MALRTMRQIFTSASVEEQDSLCFVVVLFLFPLFESFLLQRHLSDKDELLQRWGAEIKSVFQTGIACKIHEWKNDDADHRHAFEAVFHRVSVSVRLSTAWTPLRP